MRYLHAFALSAAAALCLSAFSVSPAAVMDRTPEGVNVGEHVLPDTIPFDPNNLSDLRCFAPTPRRPLYEIAIPVGDWEGGPGASVSSVKINGVECRVYSVYSDGCAHLDGTWITRRGNRAKNVVVLARSLWRNGERITAEVAISHPTNPATRTVVGVAPPRGGMPSGPRHY